MRFSWLLCPLLAMGSALHETKTDVSTYTNPVLPGWHSDPSCIQKDGLFLCVTSTFISFPGLPVYASRDLVNWRLISHVWNREKQLPGISWKTAGQQQGMYAPTIRYHKGTYYVICEYLGVGDIIGVIFKTTNPWDESSWSDPVTFKPTHIDPDLFWDDDGKVYCATHGITLQEIDLETGELSPELNIWNGTGGVWPEGPHIYKRDGYYYLMIAEGGTAEDHAITIARARKITGPYEAYKNNPILTNRGTSEYFQTVGHGDLFQDTKGNWWGLCLATRITAPGVSPMGREAVLINGTWNKGEWPKLQPVRGRMPGNLLPKPTRNVPGNGPFNADPDNYNLKKTQKIPPHFVHHRVPREGAFSLTSKGLHIVPSRNNVTGSVLPGDEIELSGQRGLAFIGRRQTHTLFKYSVDIDFKPKSDDQEAGITVFRTQFDHIDLGIVRLPTTQGSNKKSKLAFRFRATGAQNVPAPKVVPVPDGWEKGVISLHIEAANATHYNLGASSHRGKTLIIATASASLVSGGTGSFVGSLLGPYATCNGKGSGVDCPKGGDVYVTQWTYKPVAQEIDHGVFVKSEL
ncbi:xylosidase arabinosidase [Fusarium pseudoanthophilum]|uniref:Xylosidase arabinosidase n=1 Tax=Fusarium pseudoanthophilum TaxID=48495 RepID=A0A8H5NM23_9HYPO|nr:xylosidase arabinosidase [Fusarium pseudoanthophilum]